MVKIFTPVAIQAWVCSVTIAWVEEKRGNGLAIESKRIGSVGFIPAIAGISTPRPSEMKLPDPKNQR
ncbi:hypothetical protein [Phormidium sp. CCY1219]|uniref:hypothetical protein n=1 Tax=Phormidium sp. CCY1219 TaxID=2886104 RepID=UPI002D1F5675|nr:hypothetical protein [Phormidium sp. CCY1219]MEB3831851.1 hypothetical protein [Phormidium sp. CCY1219]